MLKPGQKRSVKKPLPPPRATPEEIQLQKRSWVENEAPIVLGLDPGFAATGYCLLQLRGEYIQPLKLGVIETQKAVKKQVRDIRVSADDYRRIKQIYFELQKIMHDFKPVALAYEVYQPFTGAAMRAAAWKVARVEGLIVSVGLQHQVLVLPYLTLDLKKGIAVQKSATKQQVERAMVDLVPGLKAQFEAIAKSKREHVADASGYAFLAFEELRTLAQMAGI